jgi:hypothetical protein
MKIYHLATLVANIFKGVLSHFPPFSQMVNGLVQFPALLKWRAGRPVEPLFVSVVDLNSPGTDVMIF